MLELAALATGESDPFRPDRGKYAPCLGTRGRFRRKRWQTWRMFTDRWPLGGLSLASGPMTLRQPDSEELAALADVATAGIHAPDEHPFLTPWTELPPKERGLHVMQEYWESLAQWKPESWTLKLAVVVDARPIGLVSMSAKDYSVLREVRTGSWLGREFQRQGFGTSARTMLLSLAFEGLAAEFATSEVFQDNAASQGVSRRLGYHHDGISRDVLHGKAVVSDRLRLSRPDWFSAHHQAVEVRGVEPCLPLFGL